MAAIANPYRVVLGDAYASLHSHVRDAHVAPLAASGTLDVEHGRHWITPLVVRVLHLPAPGHAQPVRLDVAASGGDLEWSRRIGVVALHTRQRAVGVLLVERHGMGRIAFGLNVRDGALLYEQCAIHLAGIPLPAPVSPRVSASVAPTADGWHVDVTVTWRGHLICRYAGSMRAL